MPTTQSTSCEVRDDKYVAEHQLSMKPFSPLSPGMASVSLWTQRPRPHHQAVEMNTRDTTSSSPLGKRLKMGINLKRLQWNENMFLGEEEIAVTKRKSSFSMKFIPSPEEWGERVWVKGRPEWEQPGLPWGVGRARKWAQRRMGN